MANRQITALASLTAPATGDVLPIIDISEALAANKNKKITYGELLSSAPSGIAAAPSFSFDSDPNTGIFNPTADTLAFAEGGVEAMRIDSSGRLGIGTTSPGQALEVLGTIYSQNNATSIVHFQAADTGAATNEKTWRIAQSQRAAKSIQLGIAVNDAGSVANAAINIVRSGTTLDNIQFATGSGSERLRIDSSGRVGIGTTSPASLLEVSNATGTRIRSTYTNTGGARDAGFEIFGDGAANSSFVYAGNIGITTISSLLGTALNIGGTERLRIDSSGRLLVGTSADSGGALLQVNGDRIRVGTAKTPASASATGTAGEICWDANYIYVCTATNTWKRTAIATW